MSGLGADTQEYLRIGRKLEILPDKIHGILMFLAFHFSTLVIKTLKMSLHKERNAYHHLKLDSRLLGEISITSDMQMTPPLWQIGKKT